MLPLSSACWTASPKEKGPICSVFSSVASLAPTWSPVLISCTSLSISVLPLEVVVVMPEAWKKDISSGPRPVFWAGAVTSHGPTAPARAAAGTFRQQHGPDLSEVLLAEHEAHVPPDVRQQFLQSWVVFQMPSYGLAHHRVLAHQHHSLPADAHAGLLHLLGAHVVCSHKEAFRIIIQKLDDLKEVVGLPGRPVLPGHHGGASGIATQGLKTIDDITHTRTPG